MFGAPATICVMDLRAARIEPYQLGGFQSQYKQAIEAKCSGFIEYLHKEGGDSKLLLKGQ